MVHELADEAALRHSSDERYAQAPAQHRANGDAFVEVRMNHIRLESARGRERGRDQRGIDNRSGVTGAHGPDAHARQPRSAAHSQSGKGSLPTG